MQTLSLRLYHAARSPDFPFFFSFRFVIARIFNFIPITFLALNSTGMKQVRNDDDYYYSRLVNMADGGPSDAVVGHNRTAIYVSVSVCVCVCASVINIFICIFN